MSDLSTLRARIKATLAAIPNVGVVHDCERFSKRADALAAVYSFTPLEGDPPVAAAAKTHLRAWSIALDSLSAEPLDRARALAAAEWRITGVMALIDDWRSQILFEALLVAAAAAFRADPSLGGALPDRPENRAGLRVRSVQPMSFAGVLCHAARCSLRTVFETDARAGTDDPAALADYLRTQTTVRLPDLPDDAITFTDQLTMRPDTGARS